MTDDHFDGNFKTDLRHLLSRRAVLAAGAGLVLAGCDGWPFASAEANVTGQAADGTTCLKLPGETAGPFPADGTNRMAGATVNVLDKLGVIREDITTSFDGLTDVADGVSLSLAIKLVNVKNACAPLVGHVLYLWQCDAGGQYSIYERATANYLRGAGVADADGIVRFKTIFPGCYRGRWPHLHFEVFASTERAMSGKSSLLTSQFAFEKQASDVIYSSHPAYANSPANFAQLSLATDGIFASNTPEQLAAQTLITTGDVSGMMANATIGVLAT